MENDLTSLGFSMIENFITPEEEVEILSHITEVKAKKIPTRNSIKRYGSSAPYRGNIVSKSIPDFLESLAVKLVEQGLMEKKPDSVTINQYCVGQGITPHVDSITSGPVITILSLLSDATMRFHLKGAKGKTVETIASAYPARALVQMKEKIRHLWQHSVDPVKSDRYSIVFRCSPECK